MEAASKMDTSTAASSSTTTAAAAAAAPAEPAFDPLIKPVKIANESGEVPLPRFGHTATLVGQNRVVLFGGATGDSGRYTITADTYCLDTTSFIWAQIRPTPGDVPPPSARAAHAAACVDTSQLVIYGGATGGGSLSSDELYLLDFRNEEKSSWMSVPVLGTTPGRRYGHTMVFNKPLLIVCGGNTGSQATSDIWILDVEHAPFQWSEVEMKEGRKAPPQRVYHSAEVCREGPAAGMMVIFGGRTAENRSLKDIWGLRQHRDGRWDWVEAPTKKGSSPEPRFQHSCIFYNSRLLIIGGRGSDVNKALPTAVYDTETCNWENIASINRFRHFCYLLGNQLYSYGGFDHTSPSAPTNDLQVLDLDQAFEELRNTSAGGSLIPAAAALGQQGATSSSTVPVGNGTSNAVDLNPLRSSMGQQKASQDSSIRISNQVYISHEKDFTHLVKQVAIDSLEDEGRKIKSAKGPGASHTHSLAQNTIGLGNAQDLADYVIEQLLQPETWEPPPNSETNFCISAEECHQLATEALEVFKKEPMLLHVRAPIKVYGDIHGQFVDLMRLFHRYKSPIDDPLRGGDLDAMDYLFLGDYVDRGSFSLEVVCLLFALKIKHPQQIHMIRGNHEDPTINAIYGFREECRRRLREDPDQPSSCWSMFNTVFEWLPAGALIENRILCIHGGIGGAIQTVEDIRTMPRPLKVAQIPHTDQEQKVTDLLWSDPSDSDSVKGVCMNETRDPDGTGRIVKFGPDRVAEFLELNSPLSMIIRAHECVMDGFERFASGKLITLFSATDYCGHHKNAGALLFVRRDLTIVPKLIYPNDEQPAAKRDNWDQKITMMRPPTPPRPVPRARRNDSGGGGDW